MSLVQLIECVKCGNTESIPYDPSELKMPWEVWPKGCPKCGCSKVDVTVICDKLGRIEDADILRTQCSPTELKEPKLVSRQVCEVCGWIKPAHYESKQCYRCLGKLVSKVIIKK